MHRSYTFSLQIKYSCFTLLSGVQEVELELPMPYTHPHESYITVYLYTLIGTSYTPAYTHVSPHMKICLHKYLHEKTTFQLCSFIYSSLTEIMDLFWTSLRHHTHTHTDSLGLPSSSREKGGGGGRGGNRGRGFHFWGAGAFQRARRPPHPPPFKQKNVCLTLIISEI